MDGNAALNLASGVLTGLRGYNLATSLAFVVGGEALAQVAFSGSQAQRRGASPPAEYFLTQVGVGLLGWWLADAYRRSRAQR